MGNSVSLPRRQFSPLRIPSNLLDRLRSVEPKVTLLQPSDSDSSEYTKNRIAFNYDIVGFPSLMIVPDSSHQLASVLPVLNDFCRGSSSFPVVIASGRHSHYCMDDGAILIDMQRFKEIKVDMEGLSVSAGSGTKLGELDAELSKHGMAVPVGTNIDTGICGLTLGGGFGYLARKWGLSSDNLISIEVVLVDGRIVTATADNEFSDLLWAHSGGSGNWGVVTQLKYRTHKLSHTTHGACIYLFKKKTIFGFPGTEVLFKNWIDWTNKASNDVMGGIVFACKGPIVCTYCYIGDSEEEGQKMIADAKAVASPSVCTIRRAPYANTPDSLQYMALKNQTPGYYYETSILLPDVSPEILGILMKLTTPPIAPNRDSAVVLFQLGGAVADVKPSDSAFFARNTKFWLLVLGKWKSESNEQRQRVREWVLRISSELRPYSIGSYNTVGAEEAKVDSDSKQSLVKGGEQYPASEIYFGENIERLRSIKTKYDPNNVFRINKNIRPHEWTLPPDTLREEEKKKREKSEDNEYENKSDEKEKEKCESERERDKEKSDQNPSQSANETAAN